VAQQMPTQQEIEKCRSFPLQGGTMPPVDRFVVSMGTVPRIKTRCEAMAIMIHFDRKCRCY